MTAKALEAQKSFIKDLIKNSDDFFHKPWSGSSAPTNISGKRYTSVGNLFALLLAAEHNGYQSNVWLSLKQAKAAKVRIKKEEMSKATWIVGWFTKKTKDDSDDDENQGKLQRSLYPRGYKVYNVDQLEDSSSIAKVENDVWTSDEQLDVTLSMYHELDVGLKYVDNDRCYYSPLEDSVCSVPLNRYNSQSDAIHILLHELSHATGHESRLARTYGKEFGDDDYSREEVCAELCSLLTSMLLGLDHEPGHFATYIKGWLSKNEEIFDAAFDDAMNASQLLKKAFEASTAPSQKKAA